MKKVILFPGTDAVENPILRAQALSLPRVAAKLLETEEILLTHYGQRIELLEYMKTPNDLSIIGFQKLVLCSLATQVAIFENYVHNNGMPDCVMGLSLGDVPRSVVSGLVTYEEGVKSLYMFTQLNHLAKPGLCVHLRLEESFEEAEKYLKLNDYGVYKSVIQNESFGLLAGPKKNVLQWIEDIALPQGLKYRMMYPFPLHTPLMKPVADKLLPFISSVCNTDNMKMDVFSTVYGKLLTEKDEIIHDCAQNISSALDFPKVVKQALDYYGEVEFISMGPSDSLLKFLSFMKLPKSTVCIDWYKNSIAA